MKRILITGATGFIGGEITRRLVKEEVEVAALVRKPDSKRARALTELGITLHPGNLTDANAIAIACKDCDAVIHTAFDVNVLTKAEESRAVNVDAALDLYKEANRAGVQKFIYISTFAFYRGTTDFIADEDAPIEPSGDLYGDTKLELKQGLAELEKNLHHPRLTVLRFPSVYGPTSKRWTIRLIERMRKGRLFIPGRGQFPFVYLYSDNMADAVVRAISSPASGIYNIFDGVTSHVEFMQYYADMTGTKLKFVPFSIMAIAAALNELYSKATRRYTTFDRQYIRRIAGLHFKPDQIFKAAKAEKELGWRPRIDLQEGMSIIRDSLKQ